MNTNRRSRREELGAVVGYQLSEIWSLVIKGFVGEKDLKFFFKI